jgi:large subunit ribosomal protein L22
MEEKMEKTTENKEKTFTRKCNKAPRLTKKQRKELGVGKDQGRASINNVSVPATKAKLVIDLIRGKDYEVALAIVKNTPNIITETLEKLLVSAHANAVNNNNLDESKLYVAEIYADQGTTLKRIKALSRGSATRINKRTCHLTVVLKERV